MRDKPLVYWVATPTEVEYDLSILSKITSKIDFRICIVGVDKVVHPYGINISFTPYDICSPGQNIWDGPKIPIEYGENLGSLYHRIVKESPDLVIKKAGWTSHSVGVLGLFPEVMKESKIKHCLWTSEQGIMRDWQNGVVKYYDWIIVNNKEDLVWYREQYGDKKKFSYMPFGCVPEFHKKVNIRKSSVMCSYSNPQWGYKQKASSFSRIVEPLIDCYTPEELALYGCSSWYEGLSNYYRGMFRYNTISEINSSSDILLGITANAETGGYGAKLAKMLSCGAFVLWDYTKGMENDFENKKHLVWSKNTDETMELVEYYINHPSERNKIAEEGQKYAYEHLMWEKNILGLVEEAKS